MLLHILAVGDVVGEGGQDILSRRLREIQEREDIHFTVVNGENASGVGITAPAGPGHPGGRGGRDHPGQPHLEPPSDRGLPGQRRSYPPAGQLRRPGAGPGLRCIPADRRGLRIGVLNLMGRLRARLQLGQPLYQAADRLLRGAPCDVVLVDFHAEATSEKGAMAWYLDGRAQAVWGTHTHVPTADCQAAAQGDGVRHRPGHDGPLPLGAGHPAGALHEPVPGRAAPPV